MKRQGEQGLYLVLISVHGLIRGHAMELGRDADTGGQSLYVVELAKALAEQPGVKRVDLLTRRVFDSKLSTDYTRHIEPLSERANIVRLDCGPRRYLRKEVLWPHLDGFIDQALQHIRDVGHVPDVVHGHYADAGYVSARLAGLLGVPMVFTGHSLGRDKLKQLLHKGVSEEAIQKQYHICQRIEAEEISLGTAALVVTSTEQEVEEQYERYDNYHPRRMFVIPPGVDLSRFHPPKRGMFKPTIYQQLARFLHKPALPIILALSRADERKNIISLIKAYGESGELQNKANLVIVAGNRDDISEMPKGQREVLNQILLLVDKYDLYGKVAYPKHHQSDDVPILYRLAAKSRGVFVNPALVEPFGLTLIEAAASGIPIVATNDGGPKDIVRYCNNGFLFDPLDTVELTEKLLRLLNERKLWRRCSQNGIKGAHRHFSWPGHAATYLSQVARILDTKHKTHVQPTGKSRLPTVDRLAFSAIDNALLGDDKSLALLMAYIKKQGRHTGFGIATGRSIESAQRFLKKRNIPCPDILITSVGTEIHYAHHKDRLVEDISWKHHIDYRWERDDLQDLISRLPGLKLLPATEQRDHKISYAVDPNLAPTIAKIKTVLRHRDLHAKLIFSEEKNLDVLPIRASKGLAIRYLSMKWGIPLERIFVVGDSGNDEEMLLGDTLAVVVANHSGELDRLKNKSRIYFAKRSYAEGILEGLEYYRFFDEISLDEQPTDADIEEAYLEEGYMIGL
ncbi:MAG: HAD-IIB family hydrolase [Gammaproteobacteria bacterium]|nr:HAD-IIB family hydrolase [Gammaproteobacteria bacterium]MDH5653878.1 HAD-IIB family hydrolase [Gammaproteobacteria bacterium]